MTAPLFPGEVGYRGPDEIKLAQHYSTYGKAAATTPSGNNSSSTPKIDHIIPRSISEAELRELVPTTARAYGPTRPGAAFADLDRVGPYTIVWLNEAQHYLAPP